MGLSLALNTARSSLIANSAQMAVVSRNTAGATDSSYSRKIATLISSDGVARVVVNRASDNALFFSMLGTTSNAAAEKALLEGLQTLKTTLGDTDQNLSPAGRIGALNAALQSYSGKPDDISLAKAVLERAQELTATLNEATATVQKVRADADAAIAGSVNRVNDLLSQFDVANKAVVRGTATGADISDALDTRDRILAKLSEEMGVTAVTREGNDMAVYTDSGVPLYEKSPRSVTFNPTLTYAAGTVGGGVFIDGVQVTGANSPMPLHSGAIVGLAKLRDEVAVTYQGQLDAIAQGLIEAFAEKDQSTPATLPDATGLFTYSGGPGLPAGPTAGLAGLISINPLIGSDVELLRDGGINGGSYRYNPGAIGTNVAFSVRLNELKAELGADRSYPAGLGLGTTATLQEYSSSSASWLEGTRQTVSTSVDYQTTLLGRASEALSNATGVNTDDETALMLQLEKSYAASAKLISVIDAMLRTLLDAVG